MAITPFCSSSPNNSMGALVLQTIFVAKYLIEYHIVFIFSSFATIMNIIAICVLFTDQNINLIRCQLYNF